MSKVQGLFNHLTVMFGMVFLVFLLLRAFGLKKMRIPPRLVPNKWFLFLLGGVLVVANWIYIIRLGN